MFAGHVVGCSHRKPEASRPDISQLRPEPQAQWMHDKNDHLGSIVVTPHSGRKVSWSCPHCPDGHAHIWEAKVSARSNGTGCPFCSGRKVCKHNSLATQAPEVARYWHSTRNLPLSPDTVAVSSNNRAHWVCPACKHAWRDPVYANLALNTGCPECARASGGRSKAGVRQKHPTFASCNHHLLSQWDHSLNELDGNYPANTTLRSDKLI